MKQIQKFYPHLLALIGFIVVSLIYFYPVLQGKKIYQSDIVQYTAMAKEQNDFRAEEKAEPFWTNSAFGGMPTYQLGAKYPNDFIGDFDDALRFLPRPSLFYRFLYIAFGIKNRSTKSVFRSFNLRIINVFNCDFRSWS
jgi:hypothetical protein